MARRPAACLITMAQGNFLALGITHWVIASQTGLVAGVAASVALLLTQTRSRWVIAIVLGVATAIVDYFMHPGMIGLIFLERHHYGIGRCRIVFCCWRITKISPRETSSNSSLRQLIRSCLVQALSEALDRSNHRDQCKYRASASNSIRISNNVAPRNMMPRVKRI